MFKHRVNGARRDRVYRASSACVACPDGSPLLSSSRACGFVAYNVFLKFPKGRSLEGLHFLYNFPH